MGFCDVTVTAWNLDSCPVSNDSCIHEQKDNIADSEVMVACCETHQLGASFNFGVFVIAAFDFSRLFISEVERIVCLHCQCRVVA